MSREAKSAPRRAISGLVRKSERYAVSLVNALEIQPSPENAEIYGDIDFNSDLALPMLRRSILERGLEEPLILTADKFILSGHRRYRVCVALGMAQIPCRFVGFKRDEVKDIHRVLAEYNPQRVKSPASILAENFLLRPESPTAPRVSWGDYRKKLTSQEIAAETIDGAKNLGEIGERRSEFLAAVKGVVQDLEQFWPVTVRTVHYRLLNNPPLTQVTSEANERWRYRNDVASYNKLSDLLTLARYHSHVPWRAIADATRETAREDLENELLDEGLPFEVASRAGELFERAVTAAATKKAADTLKSFLQLLQSTKLGRTAQFIALKKLISPDMTYESLCAGTKHTKQKVHYHVTQFRQNFYRKPIGED